MKLCRERSMFAVALIGMMIIGILLGFVIGTQYQKEQPVLIDIETYQNTGTTHYSSVADITNENFLYLWPDAVPNFTCYKIASHKGTL